MADYEASIQPEALPGRPYPRFPDEVSPASTGAGIAHGIDTAGDVASSVFDKTQQIARQTQLTDAHNQLQQLSVNLAHDPQNGAFAKQGKDAFNLGQQYMPQYQQQAQAIVNSVPDPRARQAAQGAMNQIGAQFSEQLDTHELEQHKQFAVGTANASIALAQKAAGMNANNPNIIATNKDSIAASVESLATQQGWSPEETESAKLKAIDGLHENVVRGLVSGGRAGLAQQYLNQNIAEMSPQTSESAQRLIFATQEHQLVMQEKYQKIASDNLSKEGDSLLANGKLTPDWIEAHRHALDANEFRYFYKAVSGQEESATNPRTYADLYLKAANGEDVRDAARSALVDDHSLSRSDFTRITSLVDSNRPGWFKRGAQYLDQALDPGQLNPDPAAHQSKANALQDWQQWASDHPQATDAQARDMQDQLASHYHIIPDDKTVLAMPAPMHLVGTRTNPVDEQGKPDPMLLATSARMKAALQNHEITVDDAQQEALLIQRYRQIYTQQQAAAAAKKKPQ